jgi:hypothetical protein
MADALAKSLAAILVFCVLAACATKPLNEETRTSLGTVGVMTVGPTVGGKVGEPFGAGNGALGGGAGGALGAALSCGPAAPICALLFVPTGALIGGISSARDAIPESTASEIQAALNQVIADRDLQADLRQRVLQHTGSTTMSIDLGAGAAEPVSSPDYIRMVGSGVGSVLEMSLTQLVLAHKQQFHWGWGDRDPKLALVMTARARMIRVADQQVLWNTAELKYESLPAVFSLWTVSDSGLLRAEIDKGSEALARQMAEALFGAPSMIARAESTGLTGRSTGRAN